MADFKKIKVGSTWYNVKDETARTVANSKLSDAPNDGNQYARKNGAWAKVAAEGELSVVGETLFLGTSITTQITIAEESRLTALENAVNGTLYFYQQPVSVATNAEILRITNSNISADTIVAEAIFDNSVQVDSWTSYDGYITFTGTCTAVTTANISLIKKSN